MQAQPETDMSLGSVASALSERLGADGKFDSDPEVPGTGSPELAEGPAA